jgi:hypothetical protein
VTATVTYPGDGSTASVSSFFENCQPPTTPGGGNTNINNNDNDNNNINTNTNNNSNTNTVTVNVPVNVTNTVAGAGGTPIVSPPITINNTNNNLAIAKATAKTIDTGPVPRGCEFTKTFLVRISGPHHSIGPYMTRLDVFVKGHQDLVYRKIVYSETAYAQVNFCGYNAPFSVNFVASAMYRNHRHNPMCHQIWEGGPYEPTPQNGPIVVDAPLHLTHDCKVVKVRA